MIDLLEGLLVGAAVGVAAALASTAIFALCSAFIAFGMWMLRLAGVIA